MPAKVNVIAKRIDYLKKNKDTIQGRYEKALKTAADRVDAKYKPLFAENAEEIAKLESVLA